MNADSPRLIDTGRGESVFFGGRNLYPGDKPAERTADRARRYELRPGTLYLIAAPLLWYGVEELLAAAPGNCRFLAVETVPGLIPLTRERMPRVAREDRRIRFLADEEGRHEREAIRLLYELDIYRLRRCELISLNGGYRLGKASYGRLQALLQGEIERFWQHKATLVHMMPLWLKNLFTNLALHPEDLTPPPRSSRPILVVGAGPSLDRYLPLIRRHRAGFHILAVDTAYAPLRAAGIRPDTLLLQEGQFYNQYDFLPYPDAGCRILADLSSHPGVYRRLRATATSAHLYLTEFTHTALFQRLAQAMLLPELHVPPLGSVGSTAVYTALQLTSREVVVCGVDFAFPEGRTHARSALAHLLSLLGAHRLRPPSGQLVRATPGVRPLDGTADGQTDGQTDGPADQTARPFSTARLYTAPVIDSYVRSFAARFGGEERLFRLGPGRSDMQLREISEHAFAALGADCAESDGGVGSAESDGVNAAEPGERDLQQEAEAAEGPDRGVPAADRLDDFLRREARLLEEAYRLGRELLHGRGSAADRQRLQELLRTADYLYLYFPDTGTAPPELDPTMLKRVLVSAGRFQRCLRQSLALREGVPGR